MRANLLGTLPTASLHGNDNSDNMNAELLPPTDSDLVAALTKACIWPAISTRGGLDADFASLSLSPGQRQLFSLAAAALRKCKVVLLDEVTGSVDYETDIKVREVLRDEFKRCTLLEVAHRMKMVKEYDLVVVMEGREVSKLESSRNWLAGRGDSSEGCGSVGGKEKLTEDALLPRYAQSLFIHSFCDTIARDFPDIAYFRVSCRHGINKEA